MIDGESKKGTRTLATLPDDIPLDNDVIEKSDSPPPYPFSHCYVNKDGLMCCNRFLESLIRKSYHKARRAVRSPSTDLQQVAQKIQQDCEQVFNTTFEAIVSYEDYALRAHFAGNLMCKIDKDGKFITVYATSMPYRKGAKRDPLTRITPIALNAMETDQDLLLQSRNKRAKVTSKTKIPYHELSREDVENERLFSHDISN